jgi:hypothetical protein
MAVAAGLAAAGRMNGLRPDVATALILNLVVVAYLCLPRTRSLPMLIEAATGRP